MSTRDAIKKIKEKTALEINTELTTAKGHANTYLNNIQPTIITNLANIDNYYLEVNRTSLDTLTQRTGNALLCFTSDKAVGGESVGGGRG